MTYNGKVYDVLIVGAGLAGLQAAAIIHKAGLSFLLLEAENRVGGKVLSVPNLPESDATVDLGAAWINDTSQSYIYALGKKQDAEFERQVTEGDDIVQSADGSIVRQAKGTFNGSQEDQKEIIHLIEKTHQIGAQIKAEDFAGPISQELDKLTFKQWVEQQTNNPKSASTLMNFCSRILVGAESEEISALHLLKYLECGTGFQNITGSGKDSAQYLRPKQGSQIYVKSLMSELPADAVLTSQPVSAITQHSDDSTHKCTVTVSTSNGTKYYKSRKVILAIPTPLYKNIDFSPPLPPSKARITSSTRMCYYTKVVASYSSNWWSESGLAGEVQCHLSLASGPGSDPKENPITAILDTSVPSNNQYSLSIFIVARPGEAWSEQSEEERHKAALNHLHRLFSPFVTEVPEPIGVLEKDWKKEQWFQGAPSPVCDVGVLTGVEKSNGTKTLREPTGNVHFVGTEMSEVWEGYMEGAVREGERGGLEVVEALKKRAWVTELGSK